MRFSINRCDHGIALPLVLALMIGAALVFSLALIPNSTRLKIFSLFKNKYSLETQAALGFDLARAHLIDLANDPSGQKLFLVDDGIEASSDSAYKLFTEPHLVSGSQGKPAIALDVKLRTTSDNGAADQFPRRYLIQSQTRDQESGRTFTVEGEVSIRRVNVSEIAFGLLSGKPGHDQLYFNPAIYRGKVIFGDFTPYFKHGDPDDLHQFYDRVIFKKPPAEGSEKPYEKGQYADLHFDKAYEVKENFEVSSADLDEVAAAGVQPASWSNQKLCLEIENDMIQRYECKPKDQFISELTATDHTVIADPYGAPTGDPIPLADYPVIHSTEDIHIRGMLRGKLTIMSDKDVVLEGDVRYSDQSQFPKDRFGAIARNGDIRIPRHVPHGRAKRHQTEVRAEDFEGITNFTVDDDSLVDRWVEEHDEWDAIGSEVTALALEGSFIAPNGMLNVVGINESSDVSSSGISIQGKDGNVYSTNVDDPNAYWYLEDDVWKRRADPIYLGDGITNGDRFGDGNPHYRFNEVPRMVGTFLMIRGGLTAKTYSDLRGTTGGRCNLQLENPTDCFAGLWMRVIHADKAMAVSPPPAFPTYDGVLSDPIVLWKKSYGGSSKLLANN